MKYLNFLDLGVLTRECWPATKGVVLKKKKRN